MCTLAPSKDTNVNISILFNPGVQTYAEPDGCVTFGENDAVALAFGVLNLNIAVCPIFGLIILKCVLSSAEPVKKLAADKLTDAVFDDSVIVIRFPLAEPVIDNEPVITNEPV